MRTRATLWRDAAAYSLIRVVTLYRWCAITYRAGDCDNVPLADVYRRMMFLTSRGNQDGTVANTQDTLLPSAVVGTNEASEFYRALGDVVILYDGRIGT